MDEIENTTILTLEYNFRYRSSHENGILLWGSTISLNWGSELVSSVIESIKNVHQSYFYRPHKNRCPARFGPWAVVRRSLPFAKISSRYWKNFPTELLPWPLFPESLSSTWHQADLGKGYIWSLFLWSKPSTALPFQWCGMLESDSDIESL